MEQLEEDILNGPIASETDDILLMSVGDVASENGTFSDDYGLEAGDTSIDTEVIFSGDDIFLPRPGKMNGLEDYYALKETLSWTNSTDYWPDIGETDWVVLHDSAILASNGQTVSIVKGETTNLTITGGRNLIFLDSSELTINQTGGFSELYFDPSVPAKINLNIADGISAMSQISLLSSDLLEGHNQGGARTIQNGLVQIEYQTGATGSIYLNDLISGTTTKATPTFTLKDSTVVESNENLASDGAVKAEFLEQSPDIPMVVDEKQGDADDPHTYFEEDIVVDLKETEVVSDYFSLPQSENWQYTAATYRASDDLTINILSNRQESLQTVEKVHDSFQEENSEAIDQLLVMQQWDDLLSDDLMDLFYLD